VATNISDTFQRQNAQSINYAFSKQSELYDRHDQSNPVLQAMRQQVYEHVERYLPSNANILELNAGTGIDALHFITRGHKVFATDLSDGMIFQLKQKQKIHRLENQLRVQQVSYDQLNELSGTEKFDFIFSNFGGLNCISDLTKVTRHFPAFLKPGSYLTVVIMPPVCPWELASIFKGKFGHAFRRLRKNGTRAQLEGESFQTYYHSLQRIRSAFGRNFQFISSEGLAALSPQPHHRNFPQKFPLIYKVLNKADGVFRKSFPFNRWADHIIVTFRYFPK